MGIPANVADVADIERLVEDVKKNESRLDILIANAGATWGGPFEPTPDWSMYCMKEDSDRLNT